MVLIVVIELFSGVLLELGFIVLTTKGSNELQNIYCFANQHDLNCRL